MTRRILVTGGAGFIGANFVRYWARNHPDDRVVVLDKLTYAASTASIQDLIAARKADLVVADICEFETTRDLVRAESIDTVVHFAAESHVDRSITGPDEFVRTNVVGTHSLLKAAKSVWLDAATTVTHRFHHVSTDEVYGSLEPADKPFAERHPYRPNSPYAASKAASDHLVRAYAKTYGLQATVSNCSNNYGPYQFPEKLIPLCILNALQGKSIPVYGTGANIRDWLYAEDHCRAIEAILEHGTAGTTYNIGGNCEMDNLSLVRLICDAIDWRIRSSAQLRTRFDQSPAASGEPSRSLIQFVPDRPGHDLRYAIDSSFLHSELGFQPQVRLEKGLAHTVDWYIANEQWWEPLRGRVAVDRTGDGTSVEGDPLIETSG